MSTRGEIWIPKNSREMTILRIEHSAYPESMKKELEGRTPEQLLRLVDRQGAGSMAAKKRRGIRRSTVRRIDFDWTETLLDGDADFAWYCNPATGAWDSIRRNEMGDSGFVMGVVHGLAETGGRRFEESSGSAGGLARDLHQFMEIDELERTVVGLVNARAEEAGLAKRYGAAGIAYDGSDPEDEEWDRFSGTRTGGASHLISRKIRAGEPLADAIRHVDVYLSFNYVSGGGGRNTPKPGAGGEDLDIQHVGGFEIKTAGGAPRFRFTNPDEIDRMAAEAVEYAWGMESRSGLEESAGGQVRLAGHVWPSAGACAEDLKFAPGAIREAMDGTAPGSVRRGLALTAEAWARRDRSNRWYPHESTEGFDRYLTEGAFRRAYFEGMIDGDGRLAESAAGDAPNGRGPWSDGREFVKSGRDWHRMEIHRGDSMEYPYAVVEADGARSIPKGHAYIRYNSQDDAWTFMKSVSHFNSIEVERRRA